ncbi:MFS transporter [Streptomyces anulatus]|uniref:MFS transporter n=1 Tax=Streptomyces anulatus TaxID=1892 RepID=UPI0033C27DE8
MTALEPRDGADAAHLAPPATDDHSPDPLSDIPLAAVEGVLGRTYRALSIGIVSVVFLIAFEATAVGTAMPVAARELNGIPLYAFAFSAYFTTSLFAMVLSGQWADRRGPLQPLATGITAFGVGLLLSGAATSMWVFIAGRAVQGLGGGLVIVALYVVIGRAYPERIRPAILAAFAASWVIPSVVGPLASGTVTEHLGWRWVFVGIPVLIVIPLVLALPAIRRTASGPADPAAATEPYDRRRIRLALGISAGAGLLQYAGQELNWLALLPAALGVALLVPAVRGLLPTGTVRAGRGLPSVVLLRGVAASIAVAPSVLIEGVPVWTVAVAWAFGCFGMGMVIASTSVLLLKLSAPEEAGSNSAALQISDGLSNVLLLAGGGAAFAALGGGAVGAAAHGAVEAGASGSHPGAFAAVFLPMAGVALVGAWVATRVVVREK